MSIVEKICRGIKPWLNLIALLWERQIFVLNHQQTRWLCHQMGYEDMLDLGIT